MRAFVFAALCAAAFTLPCFAASQTGRWTQFRGHADNNAVVDGNLRVQWEVPTDGRISASPTFAHGTLFVGTNSGTLYAINIRSGQILWKQHVSNALMSAP
ncbi:MAG TPA: PQQ-binding-like beta-propeller repeat protein, partial [Candidatus Baltobacteraceae bacterium]